MSDLNFCMHMSSHIVQYPSSRVAQHEAIQKATQNARHNIHIMKPHLQPRRLRYQFQTSCKISQKLILNRHLWSGMQARQPNVTDGATVKARYIRRIQTTFARLLPLTRVIPAEA
jgi:hypothetical protein